MKLVKLELKEFKGIRAFVFEPDGKSARIFGDNKTGKTTLFDAYCWLLFDRDSLNQAVFEVKTYENGQQVHGHNHEVSGVFRIAGKPDVALRKVYYEKWVKTRGKADAEFSGHTTDYYVNDVPVQKKDFEKAITDMIGNPDVFKMLSNPRYFNEILPWKDRRAVLMDMVNGISDEDLIRTDERFAKLNEIMFGHSVDELKSILTAKRREINQELDRIPIRIDEVSRRMQEPVPDTSKHAAIQEDLNRKIAGLDEQIAQVKANAGLEGKKRIAQLQLQLLEIRRQFAERSQAQVKALEVKLSELMLAKPDLQAAERELADIRGNAARIEPAIADLRKAWHEMNTQEFRAPEVETICPACGQTIPEEKIASVIYEAKRAFNENKSRKLSQFAEDGKKLVAELKGCTEQIAQKEADRNRIRGEAYQIDSQVVLLNKEKNEIIMTIGNVEDSEGYKALEKQIAEERELDKELGAAIETTIQEIKAEREKLVAQSGQLSLDLAKVRERMADAERIAELEKQRETLGAHFAQLEENLFAIEDFIRAKVEMIEEKINGLFKLARFRLFRTQVNGGIEEICEVVDDGVPYNSINNAARTNIGLDIINSLAQHYGTEAPVWIDNAEAITRYIDTGERQVIRLVVSEQDKILRME